MAGALTAPALVSSAAAASKDEPLPLLIVAGQSLAMMWKSYPEIGFAFSDNMPEPWQTTVVGQGGTSISQWVDEVKEGDPTDLPVGTLRAGPVLLNVVKELQASNWPRPRKMALVWNQGQTDATILGTPGTGHNPREFLNDFVRKTIYALYAIRHTMAGEMWREIPAYIQPVGWLDPDRLDSHERGMEMIRFAQTRMVSYRAKQSIDLGWCQAPWTKLRDGVHPTTDAMVDGAVLQARIVKRDLY